MSSVCLGFDTSNYTTSAAVFDGQGGANRGKLLTVAEGSLGLRQSEALFQHVKRLHLMVEQLRQEGVIGQIRAVGASTRPREVEGSYMPCFLVGEGQGRSLAAALGVKLPFRMGGGQHDGRSLPQQGGNESEIGHKNLV